MAKNISNKHNEELNEASEVAGFLDSDSGAFVDVMSSVMDAAKYQMTISLELTRLAIESTDKEMTEEKVFSAFKHASKTVSESFPLKELMGR